MSETGVTRRRFVTFCSAMALLSRGARAGERHDYARVALVDHHDSPITSDALEPERQYLFFYPYVSTPCFLLRLTKPTRPVELHTAAGQEYQWHGGVGPNGSVVSYAAICSHRLNYPAKAASFIGYRPQPVGYYKNGELVHRAAVILCCSERSVYDPAAGARVLAGPAPQPLASIALDIDEHNALYATGVYGGIPYERFFTQFSFRLALDFGENPRQPVEHRATVMPLEDWSRVLIQC